MFVAQISCVVKTFSESRDAKCPEEAGQWLCSEPQATRTARGGDEVEPGNSRRTLRKILRKYVVAFSDCCLCISYWTLRSDTHFENLISAVQCLIFCVQMCVCMQQWMIKQLEYFENCARRQSIPHILARIVDSNGYKTIICTELLSWKITQWHYDRC